MKVLVTGAGGFVGQHLVAALSQAGHSVRVLVRRPVREFPIGLETVVADLACDSDLDSAFNGIDVLIHLAASMRGSDDEIIRNTTNGTRHILAAMARSATRRLVLASSFVVYDRSKISTHGMINEDSPIHDEKSMASCDAYAQAKIRQEIITKQLARCHGWSLTVLRFAVIWGRDQWGAFLIGKRFGPVQVVVAPLSLARLVYIGNVTDTFVRVAEAALSAMPGEQVINVVDDPVTTVWAFARVIKTRLGAGALLPLPYRLGLLKAKVASFFTGGSSKLPYFLQPARFQAMHKPLTWSNRRLREVLGSAPRYSFAEAVTREMTILPLREGLP